MSHMTEIQRSQLERIELGDAASARLLRPSEAGRRYVIAFVLAAVAVLAALTVAAIQVFDGWHHAIVLADMVVVFFGIAAWNNSRRPHV